jgi:TPR repeat protein
MMPEHLFIARKKERLRRASFWINFKVACLASILIITSGLAQTKTAPEPSTTPRTKINQLLPAALKGDKAALEQLKTLATGGDKEAQVLLGSIYRDGSGVAADGPLAVFWYRKAAEQGQIDAQFFLGVMYDQGEGVPQNFVEAAKWYEVAATNGTQDSWMKWRSQTNLGQMYFTGQGVPRIYSQAVKWTQLAADRGLPDAMHNLGIAYENGFGVPQDFTLAHMWENLAAARDPKYATNRDALAGKMTPTQIADAQRLAREWKPNK